EGQRMLAAQQLAEQAAEDEEALGVDRPRELSLALDVDGPADAGPDGGGDPGREAVGQRAGLDHREAADLSDRATLGGDSDTPASDHLPKAPGRKIAAPLGPAHGLAHVLARDLDGRVGAGLLAGQERGLA